MVQTQGGTTTGAPDLISDIKGELDFLNIKNDINNAGIFVEGNADGKVGSVTLGGSLLASTLGAGFINASGDIGLVSIGKDVIGGGGDSAYIASFGSIAGVTIGGSLKGGGGDSSGRLDAQYGLGPVEIFGDVIGGGGNNSGQIVGGNLKLVSVTIHGSLKVRRHTSRTVGRMMPVDTIVMRDGTSLTRMGVFGD